MEEGYESGLASMEKSTVHSAEKAVEK